MITPLEDRRESSRSVLEAYIASLATGRPIVDAANRSTGQDHRSSAGVRTNSRDTSIGRETSSSRAASQLGTWRTSP